jgi:hypothetical protein
MVQLEETAVADLRYATTRDGQQCVMVDGECLMPLWPASSWDTLDLVRTYLRRKLDITSADADFLGIIVCHCLSLYVLTVHTYIVLEN